MQYWAHTEFDLNKLNTLINWSINHSRRDYGAIQKPARDTSTTKSSWTTIDKNFVYAHETDNHGD